jgi:hypothetical protein
MADTAPVSRESLGRGYEVQDVPPRWVAVAWAGLALFIILTGAGVYGYIHLHRNLSVQPVSTAIERTQVTPPEPRLQSNPGEEASKINGDAEKELGSYGWVDRSRGIAHIPIEEAMKLLVRHGWPSKEK